MLKRSAIYLCQPNLTTQTNLINRNSFDAAKPGIPRLDRQDCRKITTLFESKSTLVLGRNKCNNFDNNQFMIVSKVLKDSMMVNASDDWMDDWVSYANELGCPITKCFVQHAHIDDILNLPFLWEMVPRLQCLWNPSEYCWVEKFPKACKRYKRPEVEKATIPLGNDYNNIIISSTTNRSSSFIEMGETMIFYIHTPGHSPGHTLLHLPLEKLLFTGDLLFRDSIGRVDIPWGQSEHLAQSLRMLEDFPDNTVILPSHGKITTLGRERRVNPALTHLYTLIALGDKAPRAGTNTGFF
eukprot:Tbor_TRINITY_DN2553_c0_g1::TRINITY_DN2553_c0_g1_i1::g.426::m.426